MWTVYLLIDPRNGEIYYVGGSNDWRARARAHINLAYTRSGGLDKNLWIRELLENGLLPICEPLASYDTAEEMARQEQAWIRRLKKAGCFLFNHRRMYHLKPHVKSIEISAFKACHSQSKKKRLSRWAI